MKANQVTYPIATMCRTLGVSPSGYHAWKIRPPSKRATEDSAMMERIRAFHARPRGTYGAPRIHLDLFEEGAPRGPQADRPVDAPGGPARRFPAKGMPHHDPQRRYLSGSGPGRAQLHGDGSRSALGGRHHLHSDVGRVLVPGGRPGFLLPADRGMGDGNASAHRTSARRSQHGPVAPPSLRCHSSFRPGVPIHLDRLRKTVQGSRCSPLDGIGRRLLRQRAVRELLRDPGMRTAGPLKVQDAGRGENGDLRVP